MAGFEGWGADADAMDEIRPEEGFECTRLPCSKCGDRVGNLPQHMRACTGGDGA